MKRSAKWMIGVAVAGAITGVAFATPIFNLAAPLLSVGAQDAPIDTYGEWQEPTGGFFRTKLTTDGPSNIVVQDFAFGVGGVNGWHFHPGMVIVTLTQGSIEWFNEECQPIVYKAGDSWTEGSLPHYFRNSGTVNVQGTAVFIVAKGAKARIDHTAPPCAAALGLTQ